MTITREQVADLQPGDVVELAHEGFPGVTISGPVHESGGSLLLGQRLIRDSGGSPSATSPAAETLTVVSRAPRLYVNHPRTEAREHDVVRDGAGVIRHCGPVSVTTDTTWWAWGVEPGFRWTWTSTPPQPLTLLVDGETGQVVP